MRAVRYIGVGIAALGVAATAAAPVSAQPLRPRPVRAQHNVYLAQIRYQALPGKGLNGEYVKLTNGHDYRVDLRNWTLTERFQGRRYTFPDKWLAPHASVWLYSGRGVNHGANLYWDARTPVWHNEGDTATLRNGRATVIDTCGWKQRGRGWTNCQN